MKKSLMVMLLASQLTGTTLFALEQSTGESAIASGNATEATSDATIVDDSNFMVRLSKDTVDLSSANIEEVVVLRGHFKDYSSLNKNIRVDNSAVELSLRTTQAPALTTAGVISGAVHASAMALNDSREDIQIMLDARIDSFAKALLTTINLTTQVPRAVVIGYLNMPVRLSKDLKYVARDAGEYMEDVPPAFATGDFTPALAVAIAKNLSSAPLIELGDEQARAKNIQAAIADAKRGIPSPVLEVAVREIQSRMKCSRDQALSKLEAFAGDVDDAVSAIFKERLEKQN